MEVVEGLVTNLASPKQRVVNLLVDGIIIFLLVYVILPHARYMFVPPSIYCLYYFLTEAVFHRSPAKFLTGTRVVTEDNQEPTVGQIALRTLVRFVPFEPFSSRSGTWWHDRWSKTRVVKV